MLKKNMRLPIAAILALAVFSLCACGQPKIADKSVENSTKPEPPIIDSTRPEYPIIDSHLHYLDFTQQTDGFEALVKRMDEANVTSAIIFGMPIAKQWDEHTEKAPSYYMSNDSRAYYYSGSDFLLMEQFNMQSEEIKKRFYPFVGAINPNDRFAAEHLRQLLELYPGQIYGIGEVMSRHDDLTALTYGEPPRADHPAMLAVYDLAAEYNLPVLIHHNIAPQYAKDPDYLTEMENALKYNRNTDIIWAHVGISRRVEVEGLIEIADRMLRENPNLYYDISWVVYEQYINVKGNDKSLSEWAALITKYSDRFLIGSDKVGHWDTYADEILKYYPLLDLLNDDTVQKICQDNALTLIRQNQESENALAPAA